MTQRYQVPAIKGAFEIIDLLARQDSGLTISEIHRQLGLLLSSAATIVYTLKGLGYLEREDRASSHLLSVKLFGMARRALDRLDLVTQCHELARAGGARVGTDRPLAVRPDGKSMFVDRVQSQSLVQVSSYVGLAGRCTPLLWAKRSSPSSPLRHSSTAQADDAQKTHAVFDNVAADAREAARRVPARRLRLGTKRGEMGLGCVAAPIFDSRARVVAALSLTGTTHQIAAARLPALGRLVKRYAHQMSARLKN